MIEKLLNSHKFKVLLALSAVAVLSLTIYDKMMSIKEHKLEIERLEK